MVIVTHNPSNPSLLDLHIAAISAPKHSLSSSIHMDRRMVWTGESRGTGPEYIPPKTASSSQPADNGSPPPDCGSMPSKDDKSDSKAKDTLLVSGATPIIATAAPTKTSTGPGPAARRHFRGSMRRDSKASPSILGRDDPATIASNNPITVGDIVDHLIRQRAASRKRAERPRTSRGVY